MKRHLFTLWALLFLGGAPALAETFPVPSSLTPRVRFWTRIYSEVGQEGGLIHDSSELAVVYEAIRIPDGLSSRASQRHVDRAKDRYSAILRRLAGGKRSGLTAQEQRVLALWPASVSNNTLRRAAKRVRFQLGQSDRFRAGLDRAGQWRSYIDEALARHGVPPELAALPHVESSFNPAAYSRVGAAGLWQFTRSTGRLYMRVDNVVDERMDPFAASDGAARLLRANYNELGSWPLAITAYNHGAGGMKRAIRKLGTDDIGVVVARYESRSFGFASRNFYTEFLAALDVDRNAEHFFGPLHPNEPVVYETVTLDHFLPAEVVERALGVEESVLREHNRSLRPSVWNGAKYMPKGYELRVPARLVTQPLASVLANIPAPQRFAKQHRDRFYKVRRGDTLSKIARRHHIKERDLVALNNLRSRHRIRAGQILTLPDQPGARAPTAVATASPPADGIYRVRRGDTISAIASRFGTSESRLISLNGLRNRNQIAIGQRLVVSASTAAITAASKADKPAATKPKEPTLVASTTPAKDSTETAAAPHEANARGSGAIELASVMPETATEKTEKAEPSGPSPALAVAELAEAASEPPRPVQTAALHAPAPIEPATELQTASDAPLLAETPPVGSTSVIPAPDPSDYAVTSSGRITVQAAETLGHFAEWLEIPTSRLRRLNGIRYGTPLAIGRQAKLDFSVVSAEVFEHRRLDYHQSIQEEFFDAFEVVGTDVHLLRPGDTLWYLAEKRYLVPVWLLRQYNPSLDFGALQSGARLTIPQIAPRPS